MRYVSVPERLGAFAWAVGAAALGYPAVSHATGLGVPCPLLTLTGVPCPVCGMTTASVDLVHGHPVAAAAANPFVLCLALLACVAPPLLAARAAGLLAPPTMRSVATRRRVAWAVGALATASWGYQLHRFGYI